MLIRKKGDKNINVENLNEVISLSKKILKIAYVLIIILGIYGLTLVIKEWNIMSFLTTLLKIVSPLFIGFVIAWLFDPFVRMLKRKGIKRGWGATITYILIFLVLALVIGSVIPLLADQINEFVKIIPSILDTVQSWINVLFDKLNNIDGIDAGSIRTELFAKVEEFGISLTNSIPGIMMNVIGSLFSGLGILLVGMIIGFYLLVSFDSATDTLVTLLPKRFQVNARELANEVNTSLRRYVQGALLDSTGIFIVNSIGFLLIGLKAPLVFGLFCGLTNIIPYAGPYIGGLPAVIVGFSQDPMIGILTLVIIIIVQFVEGNFLQPIIMSKTTKLHPVTIMLGLLVFGYFWGILGMLLATPIIAAVKSIIMFYSDRFHPYEELE